MSHKGLLSEEEEEQLQDLGDRLEALDMEMEYKTDAITRLEQV
jgi:hypothetical protein